MPAHAYIHRLPEDAPESITDAVAALLSSAGFDVEVEIIDESEPDSDELFIEFIEDPDITIIMSAAKLYALLQEMKTL